MRTILAAFVLFAVSTPQQVFAQNPFAPIAQLHGVRYAQAAWGDYDKDGDLDLVVSGQDTLDNGVTKFYRYTNNAFQEIDWGFPGLINGSIMWADYDNDNDVDLTLSGSASGIGPMTRLYRNDGGQLVWDQNVSLRGVFYSWLAWGDMDNDGDLDLLVHGQTNAQGVVTQLYENLGSGQFSPNPDIDFSQAAFPAYWRDYDNDGDLDFVSAAKIFRNEGRQHFVLDTTATDTLNQVPADVASWGDIDGDGDLDVALTSLSSSLDFGRIYRNNGHGHFTYDAQASAELVNVLDRVAGSWGDYNNDGTLDFLGAGRQPGPSTDIARIYENPGNGRLFDAGIALTGADRGVALFGDYDDDADLDLVIVGDAGHANGPQYVQNQYIATVYENRTNFHNTAPEPPTNLRNASPTYDYIKLMWDAATDADTPSPALTYNVRVGTAPGLGDVMAPEARYQTGELYTPEPGNADHNTFWLLTGLEPGRTYYWSVQAVDGAYQGSAFAAEGSFTAPDHIFEQKPLALTGARDNLVQWLDYDDDGDLDILVYGENAAGETVIELQNNAGNGQLHLDAVVSSQFPVLRNGTIATGDFDSDGSVDIYLTGRTLYNERKAYVYRNMAPHGAPGFAKAFDDWVLALGFENATAAWWDADGDGDQDLLVSGDSDSGLVTVLYDNKDNLLRPDYYELRQTGIPGVRNGSISWGDFDRDGLADVLISGTTDDNIPRKTAVYRNQGDGTFADLGLNMLGLENGEARWVDYNLDGWLDFVAAGSAGGHVFAFFRNNTQGGFQGDDNVYSGFEFGNYAAFDFGDYDNDGDFDLLYCGDDDNGHLFTRVYPNENGQFVPDELASRGLTAVFHGDVAWGDNDGDGKLDILISGETVAGQVITQVFANTVSAVNTAPLSPVGLAANLAYNEATLSWSPAADAESAGALRYNVRVGTVSKGTDIVSSLSDSSTGFHRRIDLGNAFDQTNFVLKNLAYETTYYWSVQAIDAGFVASPFAAEGSFTTPPPPFKVFDTPMETLLGGSSQWGDFNGDGRFDLVQTGAYLTQSTYLYRAVFGQMMKDDIVASFLTGVGRGVGIFGDYDGDGDLDLFVAGDSQNGPPIAKLFRYIGGAWYAFAEDTLSSPVFDGVFDADAAWGDLDNDGDLDLVVSGVSITSESRVRVYQNNHGRFVRGDSLDAIYGGSIDLGDLDRDGDLDILATGRNNTTALTVLYLNTADGFVANPNAVAQVLGVFESDADLGDFDNDGDLDLLLTGNRANNTSNRQPVTKLYRNVGGVFSEFAACPGLYNSEVEWGDYNNDGFVDFILLGQEDVSTAYALLYRNQNGAAFVVDSQATAAISEASTGGVAWGDFDDDGDIDLATQGWYPRIYVNTTSQTNQPPAAPGNLRAQFQGNDVVLSWSRASDDHTPARALTYNVRVGEQSNASDAVTSMAQNNGWRKVARAGNAGADTFFVVKNLHPATQYYWSVQAIDQAYRGSAFAQERQFVTNPSFEATLDTVRSNGPVADRINLVFLAEGYRTQEQANFESQVATLTNSIFNYEPFNEYASYFNVLSIFVPSRESGSDHPSRGLRKDTYFNSTFDTFGASNFISIPPADSVFAGVAPDYAQGLGKVDTLLQRFVPDFDLVVVVINDNEYGASAIRWQDRALALVAMSNTAAQDVIHELAHTVGLGDEYTWPLPIPPLEYPNVTQETARFDIRWSHWIHPNTEVPTPAIAAYNESIGLFEGANYNQHGWYRPKMDCKMKTNQSAIPFCGVCREWLVKSLYGYRWQHTGFPQPAHRIRPLRILQNALPAVHEQVLQGQGQLELRVETLTPATHNLQIQWLIDGQPVEGANQPTLQLQASDLGNGNHTVMAKARDASDWVRFDPQGLLRDSTAWSVSVSGVTAIETRGQLPTEYSLLQNFPNPFNPSTTIGFALPAPGHVRLTLFSTTGQLVRTLTDADYAAGWHHLGWDATDNTGTPVASGVYLYRITAGNFRSQRKLVLMR